MPHPPPLMQSAAKGERADSVDREGTDSWPLGSIHAIFQHDTNPGLILNLAAQSMIKALQYNHGVLLVATLELPLQVLPVIATQTLPELP